MPETTQRRNSNTNANANGREKGRERDNGHENGRDKDNGRENQRESQRENQDGHLNIRDLKEMSIAALTQVAKDMNVPGYTGMRKQELIFQILRAQTEASGLIFSEGVLECLPEGFGFLRAPD
jgi:transcription termination factor Rho